MRASETRRTFASDAVGVGAELYSALTVSAGAQRISRPTFVTLACALEAGAVRSARVTTRVVAVEARAAGIKLGDLDVN